MAIQRLFDGLRASGVEPVVYCPRLHRGPGNNPLSDSGFEVQRFRAFVPVVGLSPQRKRQLVSVGGNLMSFDLIPSLWRERDLSVMHAHTLGRIGGIALTIAKRRRLPFVVTIHGGVLDAPDKIKKSFNAPVDGGWEWGKFFGALFQSHRLFCDADAILTCNGKEAALLQEQFPHKRVMVQPRGCPSKFIAPISVTPRCKPSRRLPTDRSSSVSGELTRLKTRVGSWTRPPSFSGG